MISREDVTYAFRLLLGREPENEEVVTHYASQVSSVRELREPRQLNRVITRQLLPSSLSISNPRLRPSSAIHKMSVFARSRRGMTRSFSYTCSAGSTGKTD